MPKVSSKKNKILGTIFIPTSNRIEALKPCLDSIVRQTDKRFEVLLIGKGIDNNVQKLVGKYRKINIKYIAQVDPGIIGAANQAIKKAKGKYFSRIDDDVILSRMWFSSLLKTFTSNSIGGVTGPTTMSKIGLQSRDLTKTIENTRKSKNIFLGIFGWIYFDYLYEGKLMKVSQFLESGLFTVGSNYPHASKIKKSLIVSNLEACNWTSRLELLKKIGGFDTTYLKGLGDYHEADGALAIKKLGYKLIFNPKVKLQHNVEMGKVEKARPRAYYRIQNFIIFYFKFFKIKSLNQLVKLIINLAIQNTYYIYKFFATGSVDQLGAIIGTIVGLIKVAIGKAYVSKS